MRTLRGVSVVVFALIVMGVSPAIAANRQLTQHKSVAAEADQDHDGVPDSIDNCPNVANADQSDCNHNGIGDVCEASAADRDDDHDGVCNAVDNCPDEANADQSPSACQMRAITVPANPLNVAAPHRIVSGVTTTLKGVARHGGNQFMWNFGDGSTPTLWMPIADPYNLSARHAYSGVAGQNFIATLSVRSSSDPTVVSNAFYPLTIAQSSNLGVPAEADVRREMAIDEGLWYLHTREARDTFADGEPGYAQKSGSWSDNRAGICAAVDAFEVNGHTPDLDASADPYIEDVTRGLNFILSGATADVIGTEPAGDPDVNGNGLGIYLSQTDSTAENGVCAKALADSKAASRQSLVGTSNVYGRLYSEIVQDTADWFAYGLNDGDGTQGGWGPTSESAPDVPSETTLSMDAILALMSAEKNMGATVPDFVRAQTLSFFEFTRHAAADNDNGGWGKTSPSDQITMAQTAAGLTAYQFIHVPVTDAKFKAGLGYMFRHWTDSTGCAKVNLGNSYAMHAIRQPMRNALPNISRITEFNVATGTQTANSFDWFYSVTGQSQEGIANNLVTRQRSDGSWMDATGCSGVPDGIVSGAPAIAAFDTMILAASFAQAPRAEICDCGTLTVPVNADLTMSGSCSTHPDANRTITKYEWDFNYNAASGFNVQATGQTVTKVGSYAAAGTYPVALRVTDDNPVSLGGPQTSLFVCNVVITPSTAPKAPAVEITQSPDGNGGWFKSGPATAHVVATDNGSGAKALTCKLDGNAASLVHGTGASGDVMVAAEGEHLIECSASDDSGTAIGSASAHVKLDATKPVISGVPAPGPNANGWNNTAVAVSFTCSDNVSGVATNSVAGNTLMSDGAAQAVTNSGTCTDNAGNVADAATVAGINIDSFAPAANPSSSSGWSRTDVVVTWNWTDTLSGLSNVCTSSTTVQIEGETTQNATCNDRADNQGTATAAVRIDKTAPALSLTQTPNGGNGWFKTAPASSHAVGTDSASGMASVVCTLDGSPVSLSALSSSSASISGDIASASDGVHAVSCIASDLAGNASTSADALRLDTVAPVVTFSGNASPYTVDQKVEITCSAADATSGVASNTCSDTSVAAYTFGVGEHTLTAAATDNAGNSGSGSATFEVTLGGADSLCELLSQFVKSSQKYQDMPQQSNAHKVMSDGCGELNGIKDAPNDNAKKGKLNAFENQLKAAVKAGWLTEPQADALLALAKKL